MLQTDPETGFLPIDERGLNLGVWRLTPALGIATDGRLCTMLWRQNIDELTYNVQAEVIARQCTRYGGSAVFLLVIEAAGVPPSDTFRKRSSQMVKTYEHDIDSACCVLEVSGFAASLVRAILASIERFGGGFAFPIHYVGSVDKGLSWLGERQNIDATKCKAALEYMRNAMPPPA